MAYHQFIYLLTKNVDCMYLLSIEDIHALVHNWPWTMHGQPNYCPVKSDLPEKILCCVLFHYKNMLNIIFLQLSIHFAFYHCTKWCIIECMFDNNDKNINLLPRTEQLLYVHLQKNHFNLQMLTLEKMTKFRDKLNLC